MKKPRQKVASRPETSNGSGQQHTPVLVYDGICALCNHAVRFVVDHDRNGTIRFAPLGGDFSCSLLAEHPELRSVDSIIFVTFDAAGRSRVQTRSDAAIAVAQMMGGAFRLLAMLRIVPRRIRNGFYDAIARRRYRWFGRHETCPVPPAEVRARFIA
jgi:predicted DCC family thiol-disulfide oxidoreductase YuxK